MTTPTPLPDWQDEPLIIGRHRFRSRLILGTGKYPDLATMARAFAAAECDCVTVAVRRVDFGAKQTVLDHIDRARIRLLPNTAGCYTAAEALRTARLARELLDTDLVKLEVIADPETLLPDPIATLEATRVLAGEGFTVMAYTSDDPVLARHLEAAGAASVMPLGSAIGSGMGILNPHSIRLIKASLKVPVIVDAGVGTASDVAIAFELGVDGVLLNTGVALARDPIAMARAMKHATWAGRLAFRAGRMPRRDSAAPSSPTEGRVGG